MTMNNPTITDDEAVVTLLAHSGIDSSGNLFWEAYNALRWDSIGQIQRVRQELTLLGVLR